MQFYIDFFEIGKGARFIMFILKSTIRFWIVVHLLSTATTLSAATFDLSGEWKGTDIDAWSDCPGEDTSLETYFKTATQNGDTVQFIDHDDGEVISFTFNGTVAILESNYEDEVEIGGELRTGTVFKTDTVNIISDTHLSYSTVATWSDGTYSCSSKWNGIVVKTSGGSATEPEDTPVSVESPNGTVTVSTPLGTTPITESAPAGATIVTGDSSTAVLVPTDESRVSLEPNTVVTVVPQRTEAEVTIQTVNLVQGKIQSEVQTQTDRRFEVSTPVATVTAKGTFFTVEYNRTEFQGTADIAVTSGAVQVVSTDGLSATVSAGSSYSVTQNLDRTSWVQPAQGAYIYGGVENTISWTGFEGAAGYMLEYTLPVPSFGSENTSSPEFQEKTFYFPASNYSVTDGVVKLPMMIPDLPGRTVEARIYAVDQNGAVLTGNVSSNRVSVKFK